MDNVTGALSVQRHPQTSPAILVPVSRLSAGPFRQLLLLSSCCSAVDMMLGGKSLFPRLTLRKAGVFSTVKRLRRPSAAVSSHPTRAVLRHRARTTY